MKREVIKKIAFVFVCSLAISFLVDKVVGNSIWEISGMGNDFYAQLITISTVIVGFAFTNMGLMLSVVDSKTIQALKGTDILSYKSDILVKSIIFCCGSLILSFIMIVKFLTIAKKIFMVLGIDRVLDVAFWTGIIKDTILVTGIILLSIGVYYFILSTKEVAELLRKVYKQEKMPEDKKKTVNDFLKREKEAIVVEDEEKDIFTSD